MTLLEVLQKTIQENAGQDLTGYRKERYSSMIVTRSLVALSLVYVDDCSIFEFELLRVSFSQKDLNSSVNFVRGAGPPDLNTSAGMASGPGAFPHDICLIALATSSSEGGMSSSGLKVPGGGVESLRRLWTKVGSAHYRSVLPIFLLSRSCL